ncbi:MAG TPA: lysine--tRNA ligase [Pseudonocardia sp.]|uniref:lysine--tRNA ligase n=1 Tax=Pseudonocardia sp. TaxID=60912 RepID=UPI002B8E7268|nr:lysine--tRNA ligase [Pseudonocardia sp.]HTF53060.1 lysine--tRNA ligase [Pseudonocardia sp.]
MLISAAAIRAEHGDLGPGTETEVEVCVAGRLRAIRRQGHLSFGTLRDSTGDIQLFVDSDTLGGGRHAEFDTLSRGDWVGLRGRVMVTRRGELSVRVAEFETLARALSPPPRAELTDVETRYRQRYLDLEVNERTREIFRIRHAAIASIRRGLADRGFIEVEGPVLQTIQGGASARPFVTHHNALGIDLYLRIALELHLKRLVVGGMERVFEIGRVFRNEGLDARHNPEFTLLEAYQAFADYHDMMALVEDLIREAARASVGSPVLRVGEAEIDLAGRWPRLRFADLIEQKTGARMHPDMPVEQARAELDRLRIPYQSGWGAGRLMKEVYDERVQHEVTGPVFCLDYPREVSPLARAHRDDPAYVERFELIVAGFELCNAYSEQNDPAEQLAAFEAEARARANGDPEAGQIDLDYIRALECGMPPTGGLGIGLDRLVMLLAGVDSIREVILFPTLRPEFPPPPDTARYGAPRPVLPPTPRAHDVGSPGEDGTSTTPPSTELAAAGASERSPVGPVPNHPPSTDEPRWPVRLVAGLTALSGLLELIVLRPSLHKQFQSVEQVFDPTWFAVAGQVLSVLVGLGLLLLADQLAKRKRTAWRIALALFAVSTLAHAGKGYHLGPTAWSALMVVILLLTQDRFRAAPDPPSLLRLARFVPTYLGSVLAVGVASLYFARHDLRPEFTLGGAIVTVLSGLVGVDGDYVYLRPMFGVIFPAALLTLGVVGLIVFAVLLFRPLRARGPHTEADWGHALRLVHTYGWDTLAYFALRDDKSFFFSSDGEGMLAYTYVGGYALVAGDPIGAPDSLPGLLDEFLRMCDDRAWNPAFLAIREADFAAYEARGFRAFYLGDEAILRCDTFTLEESTPKSVRAAVRRCARKYRFELVTESNASPRLVRELNKISARWRGKAPERGFTMSLSQDIKGEGANPEFLLCVALDENDSPGGFLRLVPAYGPDFGYTLDLMRHDPAAPNGMTEFLIASTARALGERGVVRLSMNFAMWGRLFAEDVPFTPAERVASKLVGVLNPFFQIRSLREFNAKFSPEWLPRVLAYRRPTDLPKVGLLYAGAEGFLAVPVIGDLLVPKAVGGVAAPSTPAPAKPS